MPLHSSAVEKTIQNTTAASTLALYTRNYKSDDTKYPKVVPGLPHSAHYTNAQSVTSTQQLNADHFKQEEKNQKINKLAPYGTDS